LKKNNLLILTSAFPYNSDSAGIFIKEQLKLLRKEFNQIIVISPLAYFPKILINSKKFQQFTGYSTYPTSYSFENVKIFFPRYFPIPPSGDFFMWIRNYFNFLVVEKTIKKEKLNFDIIHAHFIHPSGYVGAKLKSKYYKPLIITAHGGDIYLQPFKNDKWLYSTRNILKQADKIITTSRRNYNIITEKLDIPKKKIKIIKNGFNEKLFHPIKKEMARDKLLLPKNVKIILSIGNITEIKGHKYLIEAMNKIVLTRKNVLCIIIGKGSKLKLERLVEKLDLANYVVINDNKSHEEIPLWINACDIFVLPSLDEGSPTVIPEALGCGKPVVATRVGGVPEIIQNKDIGLLVEKQDPESLSEGIQLAFKKRWDSEKIVGYAKQSYTWQQISRDILKVYRTFL